MRDSARHNGGAVAFRVADDVDHIVIRDDAAIVAQLAIVREHQRRSCKLETTNATEAYDQLAEHQKHNVVVEMSCLYAKFVLQSTPIVKLLSHGVVGLFSLNANMQTWVVCSVVPKQTTVKT